MIGAFSVSFAQEKEKKKKFGLKAPKLNIGEKIGKVAGNLMTSKTEELDATSAKISYINGTYPPYIKTSESKYFPEGTREGDYIAAISFLKQEGIGMLEVKGEITCNGEPMEYVGLGSYLKTFSNPPETAPTIEIKTISGDEASFSLPSVVGVEVLSVNGETALPVLDLAEDMELVYYNPPGSEGTRIKVSLITDVAGARALNHFAEYPVSKSGEVKVTIPKEALANPEIAGQLNAGQFNKGENWLILERVKLLNPADYGNDQQPGDVASSDVTSTSYASFPVIVKGKQDEGLLVSLKVAGKSEDKTLGYEFYKPNATTGIPFSKASKFGLLSFTMTASTFKEESSTSTSSSTIGNTTYTRTTTRTTTYEFPQVPDEYWEYVMDKIYSDVVSFFKSEYAIEFVDVEQVTGTSEYSALYDQQDKNTKGVVKKSYKNTLRTDPQSLGEVLGSLSSLSSNQTSDIPQVNMMETAGGLDGLLSMDLQLQVGANKEGNIILTPRLKLSVSGRDETNNSKLGKYMDGFVIRTTGETFNGDLLKSSKEELLRVCSHDQMLLALKVGITTLRAKEVALGYDKIWSIGEGQ